MREIKFKFWNMIDKEFSPIISLLDLMYTSAKTGRVLDKLNIPLQYSELSDKNGKEIYEGDIVKGTRTNKKGITKQIISPVVFHHGHFMLVKSKTNKKWRSLGDIKNKDELEVIGNIYQNQDLLSKSAND